MKPANVSWPKTSALADARLLNQGNAQIPVECSSTRDRILGICEASQAVDGALRDL
jgi:hypothetical protein